MTDRCARPVSWASLVDYWAGELEARAEEALEEHLMGCGPCSELSERVAAITETLRAMLPILLTEEALARLRTKGARVLENAMSPGERKDVEFPADVDVLIHRLGGLDLTDVTRLGFRLCAESTGELLIALDDAPFDPGASSVMLACQHHYETFPHDTVAEVRLRRASGEERVERYTIVHHFLSS